MPKRATPGCQPLTITKEAILDGLTTVDADRSAVSRILGLETAFRQKLVVLSANLPAARSEFRKFWTNPFVLMAHCFHNSYHEIQELEKDILVGKLFSNIETSAGRMVESVVLPIYGWGLVPSAMQTPYSVIDGERKQMQVAQFVTLKSGPRCINDSMVRGMADDITTYHLTWARDKGVKTIEFTIGVLYGTCSMSNKKDWHILDEVCKKMEAAGAAILQPPKGTWTCSFQNDGVRVDLAVRIGAELWKYISGAQTALLEICVALVRACVAPDRLPKQERAHTISGVADMVSLGAVPHDFNVSVIQRSQLEWLFLVLSHFCDKLVD